MTTPEPPVPPVVRTSGFNHVRLTVTDIHRSKAFYSWLFGAPPRSDFSDRVDEPGVREDPLQTYGGCSFNVGTQVLGLRPVANADDSFESTRVGLDHLCLTVDSVDDLRAAAARLDDAGVEHGEITDLPGFGLTIMSLQDPDGVNLELGAPLRYA